MSRGEEKPNIDKWKLLSLKKNTQKKQDLEFRKEFIVFPTESMKTALLPPPLSLLSE